MTLESIFKKTKDESYIFVQPGGNWGDHLIYFGLECLAKRIGIKYKTLTFCEFLEYSPHAREHIYIHGGGSFNVWSSGAGFDALDHAIKSEAEHIIYGPCTCSTDQLFLRRRFDEVLAPTKKITLFVRENKSLEMLEQIESIKRSVVLSQDHDTAFHATKTDLMSYAGEEKNQYVLYGYRKDAESSNIEFEISPQFVILDPPQLANNFAHWIRIHLHASKIITNRTHSSIVGSILGKKTYLFDNIYHKNRSIYEFSLADRGVNWIDSQKAEALVKSTGIYKLMPNKLKQSWRINELARNKHGYPQE